MCWGWLAYDSEKEACVLTATQGVTCQVKKKKDGLRDPFGGFGKTPEGPRQVHGLQSGITAIASGADHVCAITKTGGVVCWGMNTDGQLGDGTKKEQAIPTQVTGLTSGVVGIAGGGNHTCALTSNGRILCWGLNNYGQVGEGVADGDRLKLTPTAVAGLSDAVAISAGSHHTCAISRSRGALCWGFNTRGELGDGTVEQRIQPTPVVGLSSGVIALSAAGYFSCALATGGAPYCWGNNRTGQLGNGTKDTYYSPTPVLGIR